MTNEVSVCNSAFTLLGGQNISSFTENSAQATIASTLFTSVYEDLLSETRWHFATRTARLAKLYNPPENSAWENHFTIPSDSLYVVKCSSNPYEIYEHEIYADEEDIVIEYIFKPDVNQLPAYFVKALEYKLASEFAIPLASDIEVASLYAQRAAAQVKKARFNDASSRTNTKIEDSPYITVRG